MANSFENPHCRILWVSDIHFRGKYKGNLNAEGKLKQLYDPFLDKIKSEQQTSPIDYIFLTGDIAFSGSSSDYQAFWDWFIVPLYQFYKELVDNERINGFPKIITIPGNHDISRSDVSIFETFLNKYNTAKNNFEQQSQLILNPDNLPSFLKTFENYSLFFGDNSTYRGINKIWESFFKLDKNDGSTYNEKRLFGHVIDHEKKIIIILVNTAWFSIGDKFNELLVNNKLKKIHKETIDDLVTRGFTGKEIADTVDFYYRELTESILKMRDRISEYGTQITGREILLFDNIEKQIKLFPDYIVITCMHHPVNWLSWGEQYDYDDKGSGSYRFTLNRILAKTDILLTGHEHVPVIKMPEQINEQGNGWHLKAGMFMEDQIDLIEAAKYFEHSRFSIIEISADPYLFKEKRFLYYHPSGDSAFPEWKHYDSGKDEKAYTYTLSNKKGILAEESLPQLISEIGNFDLATFLYNRYGERKYTVKELAKTELYKLYKTESAIEIRLCIVPLKAAFSKLFVPTPFPTEHFLDEIIKTNFVDSRLLKIHFIWPDFLVSDQLKNLYINGDEEHKVIFGKIARYSDMLFNKFRHHFFERFSKISEEKKTKETVELAQIIDFKIVKNIRFVNEPVPFWIFKRYCKPKKTDI
ncbi:MAG: metallophosphoesterase [Saprospiraceae bacterium]|nr:metallophosphoesterase [Saprospiraceae bacterium]